MVCFKLGYASATDDVYNIFHGPEERTRDRERDRERAEGMAAAWLKQLAGLPSHFALFLECKKIDSHTKILAPQPLETRVRYTLSERRAAAPPKRLLYTTSYVYLLLR